MRPIKFTSLLFLLFTLLFACNIAVKNNEPEQPDWKKRFASPNGSDSLEFGKSYLSIYSQIYSSTETKAYNLTAMVSIRNTSETDTIFVLKADYYDTNGKLIQKYIKKPIYLAPMETVEIIINEKDILGGTGSNFIFDWNMKENSSTPLFEAVMNSTLGQQGLSFTTQGVRTK